MLMKIVKIIGEFTPMLASMNTGINSSNCSHFTYTTLSTLELLQEHGGEVLLTAQSGFYQM